MTIESLKSRPAMTIGRHARAAFSLVELLTVIGILAVLISLAVIGFKVVGTAGREKLTDNQLENCKSLLAEFELANSLGNLFPNPPVATGHWIVPPTATPQRPTDATGCSIAAVLPGNDVLLLQDTARVIARLRAVAKNRESLEKMSADQLKAQDFGTLAVTVPTTATLPAGSAPLILDGNRQPIYFVPGGGLSGVYRGYKGAGDRSVATNYETTAIVSAPDRRPFWVSPGPDGNLVTGDDNLYSFGK